MDERVALIRKGHVRSVAKAISLIEQEESERFELLEKLNPYRGHAHIIGIYFLFTFASAIFDLNLTEQLPSWVHIAVIGAGIGMIVINLIKGQILAARGDNGRQPSLNRDDMVGVILVPAAAISSASTISIIICMGRFIFPTLFSCFTYRTHSNHIVTI